MDSRNEPKGNNFPYDFWLKMKTGKQTSIVFKNDKFIEFCSKVLGFYKYVDLTGNHILVRVTNTCIIEETRKEDLKLCVKQYLKNDRKLQDVWAAFAAKDIITDHVLHLFEILPETEFNVSKKIEAVLFFKNGVLTIGENAISMGSYSAYRGKVWKQQIIQRDIHKHSDYENSVFNQFLHNVSGGNIERYQSLISIIGYLLHPYKDQSFSKAVILLDERVDFTGNAHGGTGKSLIATAIGEMTPMVWKDAKKYNLNSAFAYDDIRAYHRVLYFDDAKKSFSLEEFYSLITGKIRVERKYKESTTIPQDLAPKLLISSNYMVKGTGGDTDLRRRIEFEISSYYSKDFSPRDEFGHIFFKDWSTEEWQKFDTLMVLAIQQYIKDGVIEPKQINLGENRLKMETDPEFVTFIDVKIQEQQSFNKADLLEEFKTLCPSHKFLSAITFKIWIDKWALYRGYKFTHRKSNGNAIVDISIE